ncbi:MAG: GntR family transcriptional regulator [Candidatus Promineifilaceae bacterium]
MLKRTPSLTDQAKAHIKQQILENQYEEDKIPSETDLAESLGVSRTTIRDALSRLENEGVVYRKQGAGTFVNRPGLRIKSRLEEIWSYKAVLEDHGYIPSTKVLSHRIVQAEPALAEELDIPLDERLIIIEKLFLEDRMPVILTINHIPESMLAKPYTDADLELPVYDLLAEYGEQYLSYYLSEFVPAAASGAVADYLNLASSTPLLSLEEVGYNEDNRPILKAYSYFRDDLLRLRFIRRKG